MRKYRVVTCYGGKAREAFYYADSMTVKQDGSLMFTVREDIDKIEEQFFGMPFRPTFIIASGCWRSVSEVQP